MQERVYVIVCLNTPLQETLVHQTGKIRKGIKGYRKVILILPLLFFPVCFRPLVACRIGLGRKGRRRSR